MNYQFSPSNWLAFLGRLQIPVEMKTFFPGLGLAFLGNNGPFQIGSEISQVKGEGQSFDPTHKKPVSILKSKDRAYRRNGRQSWPVAKSCNLGPQFCRSLWNMNQLLCSTLTNTATLFLDFKSQRTETLNLDFSCIFFN